MQKEEISERVFFLLCFFQNKDKERKEKKSMNEEGGVGGKE